MPWTYSGNPGASEKDAVRFLIQDTNTSKQLVQDEEIEWLLTQEANVYTAAAAACGMIIGKYGGVKKKKIGELTIEYDPQFYRALQSNLMARGASYQVPYAGGTSVVDKQAQEADSDWVTPKIFRGLGDNPAAPQPSIPPVNPLETL